MIDTSRNLSFSQLKFWLDCKRKWAYKFRDGYKPIVPPYDFMRGSLLHLGMEHLIETAGSCRERSWELAVTEWREEWKVDPEDWVGYDTFVAGARVIAEGAVETFMDEWELLADDKGPLLERRMYVNDLPPWKGLVYITDSIARKRHDPFKGGVFGVDFKSYSKPKEELAGELDLQGAIYQRGLRHRPEEWAQSVIGTCLFQIATQPPKEARINKDGSTNKTDEKSILSWKAVTGQLVTYRSEEFLDGVWNQIVLPTAAEIAELGGDESKLIPHLDYFGCKWCEFRAPCMARLKGHDEEVILGETYRKRQKGGN